MTRSTAAAVVCWLGLAAAASAQTPGDVPPRYVAFVGQSAFGNVTTQAFGGEVGMRVASRLEVLAEFGRVMDASPKSLGEAAQLIAAQIAGSANDVAYTVKEPITMIAGGVRYQLTTGSRFTPYLLAGFGVGQVKPDVHFTVGGADVTGNLQQYYIQLGGDLSGTTTKAMLLAGAGATYAVTERFFVDFDFRYNRVFSDPAIPVGRAGLGLGLRF